jgi:hypothetical protein
MQGLMSAAPITKYRSIRCPTTTKHRSTPTYDRAGFPPYRGVNYRVSETPRATSLLRGCDEGTGGKVRHFWRDVAVASGSTGPFRVSCLSASGRSVAVGPPQGPLSFPMITSSREASGSIRLFPRRGAINLWQVFITWLGLRGSLLSQISRLNQRTLPRLASTK